jgi:hypothetical protein
MGEFAPDSPARWITPLLRLWLALPKHVRLVAYS